MKRAVVVLVSVMLALTMAACVRRNPEVQRPTEVTTETEQAEPEVEKEEPTTKPEPETETEPVSEPEPEETASATFLDVLSVFGDFDSVTISGSGDDVIDIPCAGLPCLITLYHGGERNFIVKTYDSDGNTVDLLVNTIGAYLGIVTTYEDFEDATMLEIKADGDWVAVFKPLQDMTKAENGGTFMGDGVVYIDESSLSKVRFTHDGQHNFIVKAIGMESNRLLVNEIGVYDGTVIWGEPQSFFIVQADGNWSISW